MDNCNVVRDILPLYAEDMVCGDTRELLERHLEHCESCRAELAKIRKPAAIAPDTDTAPLEGLKRRLRRRRARAGFFAAVAALLIAVTVFSALMAPNYFPYSEELLEISEGPSGSVVILFDQGVTGYSVEREYNSGSAAEVYRVSAWDTAWDTLANRRGGQNIVVTPADGSEMMIYYAQNDGSEDVLVYGRGAEDDRGTVTLPRLILLPYFLIALLAFAGLLVVRAVWKGRAAVPLWLDRLLPLPAAYVLAHLLTKGVNFKTYSPQRDICFIALAAMLLYCGILAGVSIYRARKKERPA